MTATNEQIMAEAKRRWDAELWPRHKRVVDHVIEVTREGWTPPEPVDPDVLAYWDWHKSVNPTGRLNLNVCDAYLAGARMAREQERERARPLVEYVEARVRGVRGVNVLFTPSEVLAKYRGDA